LLWAVGVLVVWIIDSSTVSPMKLQPIDSTVVTILGILMTGKVVQKWAEDGTQPAPPASPASAHSP
jgi:hypothetical protein